MGPSSQATVNANTPQVGTIYTSVTDDYGVLPHPTNIAALAVRQKQASGVAMALRSTLEFPRCNAYEVI